MLISVSGNNDTPAMRFDDSTDVEINFPPLPRTVVEVTELLGDEDARPDVQALAKIVNSDPIIASSVLRRINSAYYGMRRRISQVEKAVFLLGFLEVSNLVLTASMLRLRDIVDTDEQVKIFTQVTRSSISTAHLMDHLTKELAVPASSMAYTLGLLPNIGRLVLLYNRPDDYEALWFVEGEPKAPDAAAEKRIFGIDFADLGALATEEWQLPETISEVIRSQIRPERVSDSHHELLVLSLLLSATSQVSRDWFISPGDDFKPPAALHLLAQQLERSSDSIEDLIERERETTVTYVNSMTTAD